MASCQSDNAVVIDVDDEEDEDEPLSPGVEEIAVDNSPHLLATWRSPIWDADGSQYFFIPPKGRVQRCKKPLSGHYSPSLWRKSRFVVDESAHTIIGRDEQVAVCGPRARASCAPAALEVASSISPERPGTPPYLDDEFPEVDFADLRGVFSRSEPAPVKARKHRKRKRSPAALARRRRLYRQRRRAAGKHRGGRVAVPPIEQAPFAEDGFCYLLMIEQGRRSYARRRLGANPTKERIELFFSWYPESRIDTWRIKGTHIMPATATTRPKQMKRIYDALPNDATIGSESGLGRPTDDSGSDVVVTASEPVMVGGDFDCWKKVMMAVGHGEPMCPFSELEARFERWYRMEHEDMVEAQDDEDMPSEFKLAVSDDYADFDAVYERELSSSYVRVIRTGPNHLHIDEAIYNADFAWADDFEPLPRPEGCLTYREFFSGQYPPWEPPAEAVQSANTPCDVWDLITVESFSDGDDVGDLSAFETDSEDSAHVAQDPLPAEGGKQADLIPENTRYTAWLGDAQLSLDARMFPRHIDNAFYERAMRRQTHALFVDTFHPELLPPGEPWSDHNKSTFLEAEYWVNMRLRQEFWGWLSPIAMADTKTADDEKPPAAKVDSSRSPDPPGNSGALEVSSSISPEAPGTSNSVLVGVFEEALQAALAAGAADLGKGAASEAVNNEAAALPTTTFIVPDRDKEDIAEYVGPFRSIYKQSSTSPHLPLQIARELVRNHLYRFFPHSTDCSTALHIGATAHELKQWINHVGHDFAFHLGESKDVARLHEDVTKLVAGKLARCNIPAALSSGGHATRLRFRNVLDQMGLLDLDGRKRFFARGEYPDGRHDVLFLEDCVYDMDLKDHQEVWNRTGAKVGYAIMFLPFKMLFPESEPSNFYQLDNYFAAVETAESFIETVWPTVLLAAPLLPLGRVAANVDAIVRNLAKCGWSAFKEWLLRVKDDYFPLELIAGSLLDIMKIRPIINHIFGLLKPVIQHVLQRTRVHWLGGGENGYDHKTRTWRFLHDNPCFPIDGGYVESEIIERKGEMVLFRLWRSTGGNTIVRSVGLPAHLAYVNLLDFEASLEIVGGKPVWKPQLSYIPVRQKTVHKVLNFLLGEPVEALTPGLAQNAVNRSSGGLSIGANVISRKAPHDDSLTPKIALCLLMEAYRRLDVVNSIAADEELRNARETNFEYLVKELGRASLVIATGGLAIPMYWMYAWLVSESGQTDYLVYPGPTPPIIMSPKPIRNAPSPMSMPTAMTLKPRDYTPNSSCVLCLLKARGMFSISGKESEGQQWHLTSHTGKASTIGYSGDEFGTLSNLVFQARQEHERMGANVLAGHINKLHKFMETNPNGVSRQVEILHLWGGPGTGKSEIIRSAIPEIESHGKVAVVGFPFNRLHADYTGQTNLQGKKYPYKNDTFWYLINRQHVDVLFIDECGGVDWDALRVLVCFLGVSTLVLCGDGKQTVLRDDGNEGKSCYSPRANIDWDNVADHELVYNYRFKGSYRVKALNRREGYRMIARNEGDDRPRFVTKAEYDTFNPKPDVEMVFSHATAEACFGTTSDPNQQDGSMSVRGKQGATCDYSATSCYATEEGTMFAHGMMNVAGTRSRYAPLFVCAESVDDPVPVRAKEYWYIDSEENAIETMNQPWPPLPKFAETLSLTNEEKRLHRRLMQMREEGKIEVENPRFEDDSLKKVPAVEGQQVVTQLTFEINKPPYEVLYGAMSSAFAMCLPDTIRSLAGPGEAEVMMSIVRFCQQLLDDDLSMGRTRQGYVVNQSLPVIVEKDVLGREVVKRLLPTTELLEHVARETGCCVVSYVNRKDGKGLNIAHIPSRLKKEPLDVAGCILVENNHVSPISPPNITAQQANVYGLVSLPAFARTAGRFNVAYPKRGCHSCKCEFCESRLEHLCPEPVYILGSQVGPLTEEQARMENEARPALISTTVTRSADHKALPEAQNGGTSKTIPLRFADIDLPPERTGPAGTIDKIQNVLQQADAEDDISVLSESDFDDRIDAVVRLSDEELERDFAAHAPAIHQARPERVYRDVIRGVTHTWPGREGEPATLQVAAAVVEPQPNAVGSASGFVNVDVVPDVPTYPPRPQFVFSDNLDDLITASIDAFAGGFPKRPDQPKFPDRRTIESGMLPRMGNFRRPMARPDGHMVFKRLPAMPRDEERFLTAELPKLGGWQDSPTRYQLHVPGKIHHFAPTDSHLVARGLLDLGDRGLGVHQLNDAGIAIGRTKRNNVQIAEFEAQFDRTSKAKHPKPLRGRQYRSLGVGLANHFGNTFHESLNASERIASAKPKPKLTAEARAFAKRVAKTSFARFYASKERPSWLETNRQVQKALEAAHQKRYYDRGVIDFAKTLGEFVLYASNKVQEKPIKNGELDLTKKGQLIVQSPSIHNAQFVALMRNKGLEMKKRTSEHVLFDDYEQPAQFRLEMTRKLRALPVCASFQIIDFSTFDSQQNQVTLEIEKQLALLMGMNPGQVEAYYTVRENHKVKMNRVFKGRMNGEKGSGFLDTKSGNTSLSTSLAAHVLRGTGPEVLAAKGDDILYVSTDARIDPQAEREIRTHTGMSMYTQGDRNGGEFIGESVSRAGMFPSITRTFQKMLAKPAKDWKTFTAQQQALHDKLLEWRDVGVAEVIGYSAHAEKTTPNLVGLCYDAIVCFAKISEDKWMAATKAREAKVYHLRGADGPTVV